MEEQVGSDYDTLNEKIIVTMFVHAFAQAVEGIVTGDATALHLMFGVMADDEDNAGEKCEEVHQWFIGGENKTLVPALREAARVLDVDSGDTLPVASCTLHVPLGKL